MKSLSEPAGWSKASQSLVSSNATIQQDTKIIGAPRSSRPILSSMNIREHDCVVLTTDLPEEKLQAGDVGTVVHIHGGGAGYEIEFMTLTGETVAVATVLPSQLRPVGRRDVTHVREITAT